MRPAPHGISLFVLGALLLGACGDDTSSSWAPRKADAAAGDASAGDDAAQDAAEGGGEAAAAEGGAPDSPEGGGQQDAAPEASGPDAAAEAAAPIEFSFVAFADNQFATTSCTSGVPERLAVPKAIVQLAPSFVLEAGDLMDHGYEAGAYDKLVSCYGAMLTELPFFPAPGNHDCGSGGITAFKAFLEKQLFTRNKTVWGAGYEQDFPIVYEDDPNTYSTNPSAPGSTADVPSGFSFKTYYAFKHRNAYFLSFEQGTRWWSNTPRSWVEKHLKAARADPGVQHLFVYMHHPMYSSTMAEGGTGEAIGPVRKYYEALFRQYDVTMVFSGHAHVYDRFWVPDDNTPTRSEPAKKTYPHDGKAIHYIVTGGGGGPLPNGCNPMPAEAQDVSYPFGQARGCGYHVTHVKVKNATLSVEVVGVSGSETSYTTKQMDAFGVE
jgi:hypothetical protein